MADGDLLGHTPMKLKVLPQELKILVEALVPKKALILSFSQNRMLNLKYWKPEAILWYNIF